MELNQSLKNSLVDEIEFAIQKMVENKDASTVLFILVLYPGHLTEHIILSTIRILFSRILY